jgi:two-component system CheB/CheR fusion protein
MTEAIKDNFYIIAIGTSAGGLPILKGILSQLPNRNDAAFIIIQHLPKDFRSGTADLIAPYTSMKVHRAFDGQRIEANSVYVLPENKMMTVKNGSLILVARTAVQVVNRAVDIFFESLGEDMKHRAIGIVLTGAGTDGTSGSYSIHENGGIIMVQTPDTAQFQGMPQSLVDDDHPNFNMPVAGLVDTLMELIKQRL